MTTTFHGLVTISELFAGFNLINTGVVNCLIMCQNTRKMHHSEAKYPKIFWGGDTPSLNPTPSAPTAPRTLRLRLGRPPPLCFFPNFSTDQHNTM